MSMPSACKRACHEHASERVKPIVASHHGTLRAHGRSSEASTLEGPDSPAHAPEAGNARARVRRPRMRRNRHVARMDR